MTLIGWSSCQAGLVPGVRPPGGRREAAVGESGRMDPSRKRAIRLTVALTAALLLATALIYTSFSAGRTS